ncbi:SURF-family protein [Rhodotorula diobovata]|uniref:SURF1-like protein n=1 Tax=Rhodotorula diobovata TaxID=5288 RepID=A0A5C5FQ88_9BASI|nr:SURF-family protein [Rhodotorula diobovata]
MSLFAATARASLRASVRSRAPARFTAPSPALWRSGPILQLAPASPQTLRFASSVPFSQTARDRLRARPFLLLVGLMPIFTFGLGCWQVKRLQWKLDLIDQLDRKLHQDPVRLPARIDTAAIPEFAWRKVFVTGTLDHEHSIELGPKTRDGQLGYHVFTPLVRGEGQDTIIVNRGFVKREYKEAESRPASLTKEPVALVGMLREQEPRNSFTTVNEPDKGQWTFSDIDEIARFTGAEPVLVDQIYEDHPGKVDVFLREGIPVGRAANIELRNMHLTYAGTWFALSAATAFMFFRLMRRPTSVTAAQFRGSGKQL